MAEQFNADLLRTIGEKQVRLELMTQYAQTLEQKVIELQAQVDAQAEQIAALQGPPSTIESTPSDEEIASAQMEAKE